MAAVPGFAPSYRALGSGSRWPRCEWSTCSPPTRPDASWSGLLRIGAGAIQPVVPGEYGMFRPTTFRPTTFPHHPVHRRVADSGCRLRFNRERPEPELVRRNKNRRRSAFRCQLQALEQQRNLVHHEPRFRNGSTKLRGSVRTLRERDSRTGSCLRQVQDKRHDVRKHTFRRRHWRRCEHIHWCGIRLPDLDHPDHGEDPVHPGIGAGGVSHHGGADERAVCRCRK